MSLIILLWCEFFIWLWLLHFIVVFLTQQVSPMPPVCDWLCLTSGIGSAHTVRSLHARAAGGLYLRLYSSITTKFMVILTVYRWYLLYLVCYCYFYTVCRSIVNQNWRVPITFTVCAYMYVACISFEMGLYFSWSLWCSW